MTCRYKKFNDTISITFVDLDKTLIISVKIVSEANSSYHSLTRRQNKKCRLL